MVEKMHFVNLAGPLKTLDTFVIQSIVPYNIQLVNANTILGSVGGISRFTEENPYQRLVEKTKLLGEVAGVKFEYDENAPVTIMPTYLLEPEIDGYERQLETIRHISESLKSDLQYKKQLRNQVLPIQNVEVDLRQMFDYDYMKFRFGSMPKESFDTMQGFLDEMAFIVFEVSREDDEVYVIYFTPRSHRENIDSLFASNYFKRIYLSKDITGSPKEALVQLDEEIGELTKRIEELEEQSRAYVQTHIHRIQELFTFVVQLDSVFDVRKLAVRSHDAFYLTGWVSETQLQQLQDVVDEIPAVTCIIEEDVSVKSVKPPTKLRNPKFFRPFESVVNMYGTPSYNEFDPTIFVAIAYMLLFGGMFGDVGQGLVIALIGYLFVKKTGSQFGKVIIYLGVISSLFGFVYGSVFGNEELLAETFNYKPVNPMDVTMELLIVTICFGIVLMLIAMGISIKNAYDQHNIGKMLFDKNGLAGLVFYLSVLGVILATVREIDVSPFIVVIFIIAPLLLVFMAHPLGNMIQGKSHILPEDKGGFFAEAFFELVETVLAFLSNTISFMRVGAFALNHVGFVLAFNMLSDMVSESTGAIGGVVVMIIGNVLIIALEGLIVGIQGMRLAYYELFSRFYEGDGIEFKPFGIKKSGYDQ